MSEAPNVELLLRPLLEVVCNGNPHRHRMALEDAEAATRAVAGVSEILPVPSAGQLQGMPR